MSDAFARAPLLAAAPSLHLAVVTAVDDPDNLGRVELRLLGRDAQDSQDATIWARVATAFAGDKHGAFFVPDVGSEVVVAFIEGDPRWPIVLGSLWNGGTSIPESLGGGGRAVDRWTLTGKRGTRIAIVEEGASRIRLTTPGGVKVELADEGAGKLTCRAAGHTVTMESGSVSVDAAGTVELQASMVTISAGMVSIDAAMTSCSGVLQCDTLIATTVVASTYTPGAGNIW